MRSIIFAFAFVIVGFLFSPVAAEACSCITLGPPCQSYWNTPIVFSGRVVEIKNPEVVENQFPVYQKKIVRFAVSQAFRGVSGTTMEVATGMGGGDCGYDFKPNESYLVYAFIFEGKIQTGICNRTQLLSEAAEDLQYIKNLSTTKDGAVVSGAVHKYRRFKLGEKSQPNPPLPNVRITLEGNGKTYKVATDSRGEFKIADLAAGSYTLRLTAPKGFYPPKTEQTIQVYEQGCTVTNFAFPIDASLSGRLTDEKGAPAVKDTRVNLIPIELINERHQKDTYTAFAENDGRYTFHAIPAGKYYLGIRLDRTPNSKFPYPRFFYPGTQNLNEAATITIIKGKVFDNYNFQMPVKLTERKITGAVVYPDGESAQNISISYQEVEYTESSENFSGDAKIESNGRFTLMVLNGLRYLIKAYVNNADGSQRHAEPIEIPADGDVINLKIVITEANRNCDKCLRWSRKKN